jgi:glycosyltransferase involved in cell wall biosynthesis
MKQRKLLFVVHRYAPFAGGSEYNTQSMAEAAAQLGHEVAVLTAEPAGPRKSNGVWIVNDPRLIMRDWDLVVIHGSCTVQDIVLYNAQHIPSPKMYLLIGPPRGDENMDIIRSGLEHCQWIGQATAFDREFITAEGYADKMVPIRYGLLPQYAAGEFGFKDKYNIETSIFTAAGGFLPHKRINELVETFKKVNRPDITLVVFGYDTRSQAAAVPEESDNVRVIIDAPRHEIVDAMKESELFIFNSREEGYGLVLLEAMYNNCPWAARPVGGAPELEDYGIVYDTDEELAEILATYEYDTNMIERARVYVEENHVATIATISDILRVLE